MTRISSHEAGSKTLSRRLDRSKSVFLAVAATILFAWPYVTRAGGPTTRYLAPDAILIGLTVLCLGGDAWKRLGLRIPLRDLVLALGLLGAGFYLAGSLLELIREADGIQIAGQRPAYSLTQVLHQELIVHGLLLGSLASWTRSRVRLSVVVAVLFAGTHPLLYWWESGLVLPITTTGTLIGFAFATNLLFLRSGHIGYAFAIHAAWNLNRFGSTYLLNGQGIAEAASFASIEGSTIALGASIGLVAAMIALERSCPRQSLSGSESDT